MKTLKRVIQRSFPGLYESLRFRIGHPANYLRVAQAVVNRYGQRVNSGPFKGLEYISGAAGSAYTPKILGCYEQEIHAFIEEIINKSYSVIVDVGCAEGYYAVGFAYRSSDVKVYAFDENE